MTCRHQKGDPNCSSTQAMYANYNTYPETPDSNNYSIEDVTRVGSHLVLKVKYPNCKNCAYEGCKIMVFLHVSELQVLKWKKIDPHFRDPNQSVIANESPSPAARFPGSEEGWKDAIAYASSKK